MAIKIISVGKKHDANLAGAIEGYSKRLKKPYDIEWVFLPHSPKEGREARQNESEAILGRLDDDFVMLLDERGVQLDSPRFSELLQNSLADRRKVTIVIGGAYGVNEALRERADVTLSLSEMVFPHQLVRLLLTEQIYRAEQIARGGPYHHA